MFEIISKHLPKAKDSKAVWKAISSAILLTYFDSFSGVFLLQHCLDFIPIDLETQDLCGLLLSQGMLMLAAHCPAPSHFIY